MTEDEWIATRELSLYFRRGTKREVRAVDSVSVCIPRGSMSALAGPSGSGKTSLLALLGLLERPTTGTVIVAGRDFAGCSDYERTRCRRGMGFVFQDFALLPRMSVVDNICYPLIPRGLKRIEREAVAQTWLERLGLEERATSRPEELSGGECQRVAIARALAGDPEIILADEPTSNLDQETGQSVRTVLRDMHRDGKTVVLSTHDDALLSLATSVFHLRDGHLVASQSDEV